MKQSLTEITNLTDRDPLTAEEMEDIGKIYLT